MNSEQLAVIVTSFDMPDEVRVMQKGKLCRSCGGLTRLKPGVNQTVEFAERQSHDTDAIDLINTGFRAGVTRCLGIEAVSTASLILAFRFA